MEFSEHLFLDPPKQSPIRIGNLSCNPTRVPSSRMKVRDSVPVPYVKSRRAMQEPRSGLQIVCRDDANGKLSRRPASLEISGRLCVDGNGARLLCRIRPERLYPAQSLTGRIFLSVEYRKITILEKTDVIHHHHPESSQALLLRRSNPLLPFLR